MLPVPGDPFGARATLATADGQTLFYYQLSALAPDCPLGLDRLPITVKLLLENTLRNQGHEAFAERQVKALAAWQPQSTPVDEIPFLPARVVLQDLTGVPAVLDLTAMRAAMARLGGDPRRINPLVPVDLVIDHSVQVDAFGTGVAFDQNVEREYERNHERYALLRWAQHSFQNLRVVPPGTGIVHQVNLEYLAPVVQHRLIQDEMVAFPDTLVGADSHTTMVNGLGVLGWGVGGIEAEAVMLGQPLYLLMPEVIGVRLHGTLPEGVTATDLVLTVTQLLRRHGTVGKFVEFYGPGLHQLAVADRATIANMAPEYGATAALFPVDDATLRYLRLTGRADQQIDLVERYCKAQGLFRSVATPDPQFSETLELDLSAVEPVLAGPRRPQERVPLSRVGSSLRDGFPSFFERSEAPAAELELDGVRTEMRHGAVVIAAITSCTNTSNPRVMIGAGLVARNAVRRGLLVKPYVKTSLAPGSQVVGDYLDRAGLTPYLEALGFHIVGYGCTTCIGNSGPLPDAVGKAITGHNLLAVAVLSGNRNFEARIHPLARANYLASPPLVVAYALAGTVDIDLTSEPLGYDPSGQAVYLRDLWPSSAEIEQTIEAVLKPGLFRARYAGVSRGDERWQRMPVSESDTYEWSAASTYVQRPPYFDDLQPLPDPPQDIRDARVLVMLGDSLTTDHISPAGSIPGHRPAGRYLIEQGVSPRDFNSFGARRGNHQVMVRGTFGNIRLRNELAPALEGDYTIHFPSGEVTSIFEAAERYRAAGTPLIVIAGQEYGTGSSRDWAAKGCLLLGVRAVLAESYERIHRANLVGMGVLPLQFEPGQGRRSLGLNGTETIDVSGISMGLRPGQNVTLWARRLDGTSIEFQAIARLDSAMDVTYYQHGGILHYVLRQLLQGAPVAV